MVKQCFVPKCKTVYSLERKLSFFKAPRDLVLRAKWKKAIGRTDKDLSEKDFICELHFKKELVIREWGASFNGKVIMKIPVRAKLVKDATPSIFPGRMQTHLISILNNSVDNDISDKSKTKLGSEVIKVTQSCEFVGIAEYQSNSLNTGQNLERPVFKECQLTTNTVDIRSQERSKPEDLIKCEIIEVTNSDGQVVQDGSTGISDKTVKFETIFNAGFQSLEQNKPEDLIKCEVIEDANSDGQVVQDGSTDISDKTVKLKTNFTNYEYTFSSSGKTPEPISMTSLINISEIYKTENMSVENLNNETVNFGSENTAIDPSPNHATPSSNIMTFDDFLTIYDTLTLPSATWAVRRNITDYTRFISFYDCGFSRTKHIIIEKEVIVSENLEISVYILEKNMLSEVANAEPFSVDHILNVLSLTDAMKICTGGPTPDVFGGCRPARATVDVTKVWRHKECDLLRHTNGLPYQCEKCSSLFSTLHITPHESFILPV